MIHFLTYLYKLFDSSKPHVIIDNKFFYVPLMLNDVVHAGSSMQTRTFALLSKHRSNECQADWIGHKLLLELSILQNSEVQTIFLVV